MDKLREKLKLLLSYKRVAAIFVFASVVLSIPLTLSQLSNTQDTRSSAAGTISVSLSPVPQVEVDDTFITRATMNTNGNLITGIDITLTYNSDVIELVGQYNTPPGFTTTTNNATPGTIHFVATANTPVEGQQVDIGNVEFKVKLVGPFQIQLMASVSTSPPTATPILPTNTPTPADCYCDVNGTRYLCGQTNADSCIPGGIIFACQGNSTWVESGVCPAATNTPTPTATPTPLPSTVTPVCAVQCVAPPVGCQYENNTACSCGTLTCPACPLKPQGDANCDEQINTTDFNIWRDEFLNILSTTKSDFNLDGTVNTDDFNKWRDGFLGSILNQ